MALETKLVWNGLIISKEMDRAIERALIRSTNKVQADAKRILTDEKHVDTGVLRGSIVTAIDSSDNTGTVSTNIEYAPYIEFGTGIEAEGGLGRKTPWTYFSEKYGWVTTSGHKPYPFMRPARDNNKDTIKKMFISELKKVTE